MTKVAGRLDIPTTLQSTNPATGYVTLEADANGHMFARTSAGTISRVDVHFIGTWSSSVDYFIGDMVKYLGVLYWCYSNIAASATDPYTDVANHWVVMIPSAPRTATLVVAANNATFLEKQTADYICDGTSDQVEINAALAACTAFQGGSVQLTSGVFTINGAILIPTACVLKGTGEKASYIFAANDAGSNTSLVQMVSSADYAEIRNLMIDGNKANNTGRTGENGVYIQGSIGCKVVDCTIKNMVGYGIFTDTTSSLGFIEGNTVTGIAGAAAVTIGGASASAHRITNNRIYSNSQHGLSLSSGTHHLIASNTLIQNGLLAASTYYNILINSGADNCFVHGNKINRGPSGNRSAYGIAIASGATNTLLGLNDTFEGGMTGDVSDSGTNTRRLVKRQLAYVSTGLAGGSAIAASTETTLLDNTNFRVDATNSLLMVMVRLAAQIVMTAATGAVGSAARIDSSSGATQNGTRYRLGSGRQETAGGGNAGIAVGGTFSAENLTIGTHTIKVTITSEGAGLIYERASNTEFLEVDIMEFQRS